MRQGMAVTHWFFSAGPHGWVTITSSAPQAAPASTRWHPAFPMLCATLPAIP